MLAQVFEKKIEDLINKLAMQGKQKLPTPKIEYRKGNCGAYVCRASYNSLENKAIFYFEAKTFSKMSPATKTFHFRNLIVSTLQLMYFNSQKKGPEREFLLNLLEKK